LSELNNHNELVELKDLLKKLKNIIEPESEWWRYQKLKDVGGYIGICILMALYVYGPFDRVSQWIKTSKVPRSSFYLLKRELVYNGLITRNGKELTLHGRKVCGFLKLYGPIITRTKFYEIARSRKNVQGVSNP